jgi:hypothetical protein
MRARRAKALLIGTGPIRTFPRNVFAKTKRRQSEA